MKRYAIWSKKHDINLFKDGRTFKALPYAKKVLLTQSEYVDDNTLYVKEVESEHPLKDFFSDIENNITPDEGYESAAAAKLESMADDHAHLGTESFDDLAKVLVDLYFNTAN